VALKSPRSLYPSGCTASRLTNLCYLFGFDDVSNPISDGENFYAISALDELGEVAPRIGF
jgi:hypothetical protein